MAGLTARGRPRREPYPGDGLLGTLRCRLGYQDRSSTKLVTEVPPDQANVAPSAYGETAANPLFGQVYAYRDLTRGYGQKRLRGEPNGRYAYCLNADPSGGPWLKGPEVVLATPATRDSTNGINRFFEIGGKVYALNGQYALDGSTTGTGWTVSKDFGAGKVAADVVVAQTNQASSTRYAWVGMGDVEKFYYYDGTTWTQHATLFARAWAVDTDTLFRADDTNRLSTCDLNVDATVAANWASATDRIGTKDAVINRMALDAAGGLVVAKRDDLYTLNADGSVNRLFGHQGFPIIGVNGEPFARWNDHLYVTYGLKSYRLAPDGGLTQVGPEMLPDNDGPIRGNCRSYAGTDFGLVAGLYNPDADASYLVKHTGELIADDQGRTIPVWHGSLTAAFAGVRITALHQSTIGAPTNHKRLYLGFSDGTVGYLVLPCTYNAAACSSYRFSTADGYVYLPRTYFYFPREIKGLHRVTGEADAWSSTAYADFSYKTNNGTAYTDIEGRFDAGESVALDFPRSTLATYLDPLVTLTNTTATESPRVSGVGVEFRVRTVPRRVYQISVIAEDGQRLRDNTPVRLSGQQIEDYLAQLSQPAAGSVDWTGPDEQTREVTVSTPRTTTAWDRDGRPRAATSVLLVQSRLDPTTGNLFSLEGMTLAEMEAFTLAELGES